MGTFATWPDNIPSRASSLSQGSLDTILERSTGIYVNSREQKQMTPAARERLTQVAERYATEGYRVLALAEGADLNNLHVLGEFGERW